MNKVYDFFKNELDRRKKERLKFFVFKARDYQKNIIDTFKSGLYNFFIICWARRLGKDLLAFSLACEECLNKANTVVYYMFPTMKQGKMMILDGFTNERKRIIEEVINKECLLLPEKSGKLYHSDNSLRFKNGSIIYFVDAQNADTKIGGNLDILIISEMATIKNRDILLYLIPSVMNVNGKIILVSTPRFLSYFNELLEDVKNIKLWFKSILSALDKEAVDEKGNPVWSDEKLEKAKQLMSESKFRQDYLCDTDVANENAIYAGSLLKAEWIKNLDISNKKLYVSEDLGINDSTALVFTIDNTVIHHYANTDKATIHYIEYIKTFMKEHNIRDVEIILPHDARNRQDAIDYLTSRREAYSKHFRDVRVLRAYEVNKTIEITRHSIEQHKIKFLDCTSVRDMVRLMKAYEWKIDNSTGENLRVPIHGRGLAASNTCDAIEYYCMRMFLEVYEKNIKDLDWGSYEN
nr:MAG TPA: Large subunit terminase [Caudoviricetes sp.]